MKSKTITSTFSIPGVSPDNHGAPPGGFILSIEGLDATGKSRLALEASCAGPMAYYSTDGGVERAGIDEFLAMGRDIQVGSFEFTAPKFVPKTAGAFWEEQGEKLMKTRYAPFIASLNAAVEKDSGVRVIVLDTATEFWDLAQLAHFGKLVQNNSLMYGPVHTEFRGPLRTAKQNGKIVILLHHVKQVYRDVPDRKDPNITRSEPVPGVFTRQGNAKINYLCDALIRCHRTDATSKKMGGKVVTSPAGFEVELLMPKMNMSMQGARIETPDFATLMSLLKPSADPSCWEA